MGFSSQGGRVIIKTQATPGVYDPATGTGGLAVKLRSGGLGPARELLIPDPEIGGGRDVVDALLGAGSFSGDYEFYARPNSLLTWLNATLGTTNSPAPVSGVVTHAITPSDGAQLPFLSISERIGASLENYAYNDCVLNTLHLEAEANGYLMGTAGIVSAKQVIDAAPLAAGSEVSDNTPLTVGTNITITYNAVTLPAKSFSLDINNNYEDDDYRLGSFYIGDLTPKRREVTAAFTIRPQDNTLLRQAAYGTSAATAMGGVTTKQQLVITCTTYDTIPSSAVPYSVAFTIPKFALRPNSFGPSGDDIIEVDFEGQGLRPVTATPIMSVALKSELLAVK
jgi:hypothetical protein